MSQHVVVSDLSETRARLLAGAAIAAVAVFLVWRMDHPLGVRPDSWSEAEVIVSGWSYAREGLLAHAALPHHQIGPPTDPYFLYANYPPLSNLLFAALHRLGLEGSGFYRLPAIAASLAALWLWFRFVALVLDRATAASATVALASSFGFLAYADNVHQHAYPAAPQMGALLCFARAAGSRGRARVLWLCATAACLLLVSLFTVELHLWLPIALLGYSASFSSRVRLRQVALVVAPLAAGIALQSAQMHFGSPIAPEDRPSLAESLYRRSFGFAEALDTPLDASGRRLTPAAYPSFMAERFAGFYGLPPWLVALAAAALLAGQGRLPWPPESRALVKLLATLLAAGCAWLAVMMQQSAVHPGALRQLLPFHALLLGALWVGAVRSLGAGNAVRARWIPLALLLAALHGRAAWSDVRMHTDSSYFHPLIREPGWSEGEDLRRLAKLPEGRVILTNHNRLPLIRYWSKHPTYAAWYGLWSDESARDLLELTFNHLRGLYGDSCCRLVYLYRFAALQSAEVRSAARRDPWLRLLLTGSRAREPDSGERAIRALEGEVPSTCPVLMHGVDWVVFDLAPLTPALLRDFARLPIPRLAELPPPR